MDERLYINGILLDLKERSVARSLQINDFREVKDRQANYSNNIKIPKTSKNMEVFQDLGLVGSTTRIPYEQVSVKYVLNGIELIEAGKGILKNTNEYYNLVIYDGNIGLTDLLGTLTLADLDYDTAPYKYNHNLNAVKFFDSFENTSGYVYALKGQLGITTIEDTVPSFYIHTLFEMIFVQKGWSISGDIFSSSEYLTRVQTVEQGYLKTVLGSKNSVSGYPKNINVSRSGSSNKETVVATLNAPSQSLYEVKLNGVISLREGQVTLRIKKNGTTLKDFPILVGGGNSVFDLEYSFLAILSDTIQIVEISEVSPFPPTTYDYDINYDINITVDNRYFQIRFEDIIGATKQIDFVKDVMQRFNLSFRKKKNENELEFITSENLLTDISTAEDWSYIFSRKLNESYKSTYAQENKAIYRYDEDSEDYADGSIFVNDVNLPLEKIIFTSIYKATKSVGNVYQVKYWDKDEPNQDGLRIFKKEMSGLSSLTFRFLSTDETSQIDIDYALWNFDGLDFQTELDTYYNTFKKFLDDYKIITVEVNLNAIDIYQLDFFKLKYIKQLGRYFYVNKIINFRENRITKVELIQIPI
tara:strand:- start:22231 stop:23988 length:1758 start_codon:yes stop_codon:yes gene_type:complete